MKPVLVGLCALMVALSSCGSNPQDRRQMREEHQEESEERRDMNQGTCPVRESAENTAPSEKIENSSIKVVAPTAHQVEVQGKKLEEKVSSLEKGVTPAEVK